MKKLFLAIFTIFGIASFSQSVNPQLIQNVEEMNLKGKVKSIKQIQVGGKYDGYQKEIQFNETGGVLTKTTFSPKGEVMSWDSYVFSYQGSIPTYKVMKGDTILYQFNENGCLTDVKTNKLYEVYTYENSRCKKSKREEYDLEGNFKESTTYFYNEAGFVIKEIWAYASGSTVEVAYKYDEAGNVIEQEEELYRMVYAYDEYGNKTVWQYYNSKGELRIDKTYTYTYDGQGNWIKMEEFRNGKPEGTLSRTIEYYKL